MKRLLLGVAVTAALMTAAPANADAYLSKYRAQARVAQEAEDWYYSFDWATDWGVDRPYECDRLGWNVVECGVWWEDENGGGCEDTFRVRRLSYGFLRISFPYDANCY